MSTIQKPNAIDNELLKESVSDVQKALLKLTSILGIDAVSFDISCDVSDDIFAELFHDFLESRPDIKNKNKQTFSITKKGTLLR